jgi:LysM repeat protein
MAKRKSGYKIETVSAKEAHDALSKLRKGKGGGSKYHAALEAVKNADKGELVKIKGVPKNEVQPMRSYIYSSLNKEEYTVKSAREDEAGSTYTVVAGRTVDFD